MDDESNRNDADGMGDMLSKYPVNVDELDKGSRLTVAQVEHIIGCKFDDRLYPLRAMRLAAWISDEKRRRGIDIITRILKGEVVLLTDTEAVPYIKARWDETVRDQNRMIRHSARVDRAALESDDARAKHDRATASMAQQYAAARAVRRKMSRAALKPVERQTPATLGAGKKN